MYNFFNNNNNFLKKIILKKETLSTPYSLFGGNI